MLIHLLHRIDLTDPAIPISIPGRRWLPLYYCFDSRLTHLGYQLLSDEEMLIHIPRDQGGVTREESWPEDNYPLEFPRVPIAIEPYPYDPTDLDDAYAWAGVFGISQLSTSNQALARTRVAELMDGLGFHTPETDEEFDEALSYPFMQGKPNSRCPNPVCGNHDRQGSMATIAIMPAEPVTGIQTFGSFGDGVIVIFELCPKCQTIQVTNQCD